MSRAAASLVGKSVKIGDYTVNVREKIGEGGYAWVYRCDDASGNQYALKYVNCLTPERFEQFKLEADILSTLPEHPNIVKLFASDANSKTLIINLLYEYCPMTAISILSKREMTREEILIFFTACATAVQFLHQQNPPIIHRDLKPENLLVALDGTPKLCDFGSATTKIYKIKNVNEINSASEDIERNTTQNYRAPEMIDLYKRVEIGTPADVWALGCTLYKLIYRDDLYKPDERLPILQGKLRIPQDCDDSFAMIIESCIKVDPTKRPPAEQIAGTAKMLRGPHDKIAVPVPQNQQQTQAPIQGAQSANGVASQNKGKVREGGAAAAGGGGGEWKWANPLKFVQEQYRSWVASGASQWAIKATFASNDPPASKYVRRVLLASVRHTEMSQTALADFLLNQRPWQTDPRVAAKSLYLILLLIQYETNLNEFIPITVKTDQVIAHFTQSHVDPKQRAMVEAINQLGYIVRTKVMLHAAHKELEGNLAFGDKKLSENLENDLARYLSTIAKPAKSLLSTASSAKDFAIAVMSQPAIEEVSNAFKLLQYIRKRDESVAALNEGNAVLDIAKKFPYLQTAIIFPDDSKPPQPPFQRFVVQQ
ncbi:AGC family protein kinase [Tritrichomonas foetus]|uniref:non-specific serine/threonine protein kinase n=1 Tax=Tritrichomonas foetus TaxID=1144522 RepID=A0A1J4J5I1_9EUKA|nr:AGC family protein kinase [Tritrichomonas foetus]|eukprot:OHS94498.1 AGC family protein kinase [Tritrichomonas foetus]